MFLVCLSVCKIIEKIMDRFLGVEMSHLAYICALGVLVYFLMYSWSSYQKIP